MTGQRFSPGELRLAIMGDLLRNPAAAGPDVAARLSIGSDVVRVTLSRLESQGLVRELAAGGFMLTRAGLDRLASIRRMISA